MKYTFRTFYFVFCLLAFCAVVLFAFEAYAATPTGLQNPLNSNFNSVPAFIAGALKALALIALPIISLFFVISGFLFVTARGNQEKLQTAKRNFMYVIIGAILILGAWIIATMIAGTVSQIAGSGTETRSVPFFGTGSSPY